MIHLLVKRTKADGTTIVETDQEFNMSKSVFFQRASRTIPMFSGMVKYNLQKHGKVEINTSGGEILYVEVSEKESQQSAKSEGDAKSQGGEQRADAASGISSDAGTGV